MNQWKIRVTLLGAAAATALGAGANAELVNLLTAGSSGTINGARFETTSVRPTGTGTIDSFLRIHEMSMEQGYNTSGRPVAFDEITDPNFTRNLRLSELSTRTINGTTYYEFLLDVNEPNSTAVQDIALTQLRVFTGATGSMTTNNISQLGALRYNLDAIENSGVNIRDLNDGSGSGDVRIFIPTAAFAGANPNDFVYMFAAFGNADGASEGGFEEFAALTVIPLPTAAGMAMAGLCGIAVRRRR
jgi:hypothetical protein